ncbi:Protein LONGIFOLIA 1 [Acorus gramineus]|uniref:Protein LONGIFOLIA 1 n=1 Tax=Acorus gramineus TaxID=55184 RepID=A0AAV9AVB5_ACOGR|nr:Protein LONGIFOLIA 1 [Acorus gramineus]
MSTNAFTEDEEGELQKQMGCMAGIFQLFDRQRLISGRRFNSSNGRKMLPSGQATKNNNLEAPDAKTYSQQTALERNHSKIDNQRFSMESSRASFTSSSCSSSFSSLDCNKTAQPDPPIEPVNHAQTKLQDLDAKVKSIHSPCREPPIPPAQSRRESLDFRDVVKDSIYKDSRSLSVKTVKKEAAVNKVMKHIDSPRPFQPSEPDNEGKPRVPVDLNESLKVLPKLKEAPWYYDDPKETKRPSYEAKDRYSISRDAPRFSFDSKDTAKSAANKLRELPRLSLDSREGSLRASSNIDSKSNSILKEFHRNNTDVRIINRTSNLIDDMEALNRPPTVVAKLMGLEALPSPTSKSSVKEDQNAFRPQERVRDGLPFSPKSSSFKESLKPRTRTIDPVIKPMPSSIFPVEPAPWKQQQGRHGSQKGTFKPQDAKERQRSRSVYDEIKKRLKELEFSRSDKDLRTLKYVLDSMQAKGLLETRRNAGTQPIHTIVKENASPRPSESAIGIMKPGKSVDVNVISSCSDGLQGLRKLRTVDSNENKKASTGNQTGKAQSPKLGLDKKSSSRFEESILQKPRQRTAQTPPKFHQFPRENNGSNLRNSSSTSPRLQQKKSEPDKKSRSPSPSSETSRKTPQRQASSVRQNSESISPTGRLKQRTTDSVRTNDDQLNEISRKTRNSSLHRDQISVRSDSNASLASQVDSEVTSASTPGVWSSSSKAAHIAASLLEQKKSSPNLNDDNLPTELELATPDHSSPISVLDSSFYRDDLVSSLVNQTSGEHRDGNILNPEEISLKEGRNSENLGTINNKKSENIKSLVQKLQQLNADPVETPATNHIASICDNEDPDYRYISEMLLASGLLLRDLATSPVQLHPSGNPINADLFLVLEQTKSCQPLKAENVSDKAPRTKPDHEKVHRKLLFDTVNEILIQKLALEGQNSDPWVRTGWSKLALRPPSGQRLLKDLCTEIDRIQLDCLGCGLNDEEDGLRLIMSEDSVLKSEDWEGFKGETSDVILDIERLIFKDLIDEIVRGQELNLEGKASRQRRQFVK